MSRDVHIDDVASDTGSTGGSPYWTGLPDFPLPPMYPGSASQQASGPPANLRLVVDPIGRQTLSPTSLSGRHSPNTQWFALGRTSPRAAGVRKEKGVDPAIPALQS